MRLQKPCLVLGALFCLAVPEWARAQADFIRGDLNCDQTVNALDVNLLQQHIFVGAAISCRDAADVDDDGGVSITDLNLLQSYVNTGSPQPRPPFPSCGQDPTGDGLTCVSCCPTIGGCDTLCLTAPDFTPAGDTSINGGHLTFCDFVLGQGVDVTVNAACTLDVAGAFLVDSNASLRSHCTPLVINHLQDSGSLRIYGEVTDTCASSSDSGGTLVVRSQGSMIMGTSGAHPPAKITAADIFIGDPDYAPRPQPDSVVYSLTGESTMTNLSPMANLRATHLGGMQVEIEMIQLSLTGLPMQRTLHFGDGDSIVSPPPTVQHTYSTAGTYRVSYAVSDAQGNVVRPSLIVSLPSGTLLQGQVSPFVPSSLLARVQQSVSFEGEAPANCATAAWDFDGDTAPGPNAQFAFEDPGTHVAMFSYTTETGEVYEAQVPLYVKLEGATKAIPDPPAPSLPFPGCAAMPLTLAVPDTHSTSCVPCSLCTVLPEALGFPPGTRVLVLGGLTLKSTRVGGWLVTGYAGATVIIRSGLVVAGAPGKAGGIGGSGKPGGGYGQVTLGGQIVECGGTYIVGSGGDGGAKGLAGCPAIAKAGRGGDAGGVVLAAPLGTVSWCGDITIVGADGGDGGAAAAMGSPAGACLPGCGANARGGRGGMGGGGLVAMATTICYDSNYSVTFAGGGTGGNGGSALAVASDGGNCAVCAAKAGDGGNAGAYGGRGGNSFFYFAMSPPPTPEDLALHLLPTGTWTGGDGADGDATAGNGGNALADCCNPPLPGIDGGDGGFADAHGGRKGRGVDVNGVAGTGTATCGIGGNGKDGSPPGAAGAGSSSHDDIAPGIPCNIALCPPGFPGAWCPQNMPWNPRWNLPDGYKFGFNDTTLSGSLYEGNNLIGTLPMRLAGQSRFGQLSGSADLPVYAYDALSNRVRPGAISIDLSALPNSGTAEGFYADLHNYSSQPNSVHLMGYAGGNLVSHQMGSATCAESTLEIPVTLARVADARAQQLDSVIIWGLDFSFQSDVGTGIEVSSGCPIVMTGDVNLSSTITSSDIIGLVNYVFKGGAAPLPCAAAGDVNCNGAVTSADIIHLVNFVFKGGIPPCNGCTSPLASGC